MKQHLLSLLGFTVLSLVAAVPAAAEGHREGRGEMRHERGGNERRELHGIERHEVRGWGGERDIRHFDHRHLTVWRGGAWRHGTHNGRFGWWWVTAGIWYFYPFPIYPYPDPFLPPVVIVQPPVPPEAAAPAVPAPPQSWYYCEASKGYYPYISSCAAGWVAVPAKPAGTPP